MIRSARSGGPKAAYICKPQLTLEAASESLLQRKARELHRHIVRAPERLYPGRVGDHSRAVADLRRPAAQAAAQYVHPEAFRYLSRALGLVADGDLQKRYDLHLARESALDILGQREVQGADSDAPESLSVRTDSALKPVRPGPEQRHTALHRRRIDAWPHPSCKM